MYDDWNSYITDGRTICKYGLKCYQKNPEHHATYKHPPPKDKANRNKKRFEPYMRQKPGCIENKLQRDSDLDLTTKNVSASISSKHSEESQNVEICHLNVETPTEFIKVDAGNKTFKELFLVDMTEDFFKFFDCLSKEGCPEQTLSIVNLQLIGPYELLLGKLPKLDDKELYLTHWRFFYDPPEFQSVVRVKGKELHFGYYRDDPEEKPVFVASNDSSKGYEITPVANNIFGAVYLYLTNEKHHSPFTAMACKQLALKVKSWAAENNFSLEEYDMKTRKSQIVSKTFHGAGIVVPYNKKTQLGYRKLADSYVNIKKMFSNFTKATTVAEKDRVLSELQPVITYANIAVDECDFGTGLEAGINLFCSGIKELEPSALSCLCSAYNLLKREAFSKIIQGHLKYRRRGPDMSIVNMKYTNAKSE